jgi:hypothetical protein
MMDVMTEKAIFDDLATLINPINIMTDQPWSAAEMYEYTESLIAQRQGTGQEAISNRIADADAQGFRPMSVGEEGYLSGPYLYRAASAGLLRKQMSELNSKLVQLVALNLALTDYKNTLIKIAGDSPLAETIKDELGSDIDNPVFITTQAQHAAALTVISNIDFEDWKLLAQRRLGSVIEDSTELLLAMINIIPTINILEAVIENNTAFKVNKRKTFENAKAELIGVIQPIAEELEL